MKRDCCFCRLLRIQLQVFMLVTVKDFKEALKKIKENPQNHGLSSEDYEQVVTLEKQLKETTDKFNSTFQKINDVFSKAFAAFQSSALKFEEKFEEIKFVANHDWLISFNLFTDSTLQEMFEIINKKDKKNFEEFVMSVFPRSQKNIFAEMRKRLTHRKAILTEIEQSYNHKFYFSVVTLCYTQVDGICNEKLNYGFFDTNSKTHDLKIKALEVSRGLLSKIAGQLQEPRNEISRYVKEEIRDRTFQPDSFNRHLVLHGHSIHYGTRKNAIRAILLMDFVCALVTEDRVRKPGN